MSGGTQWAAAPRGSSRGLLGACHPESVAGGPRAHTQRGQDRPAGPHCWSRRQEPSPSPPALQVRAFLQPPLKGVVMETFGSGNGPTKPELLQELQVAARRGLVIINCTLLAA